MTDSYDDIVEVVSGRQSRSRRKIQRNTQPQSRRVRRRIACTDRRYIKAQKQREHAELARINDNNRLQDRSNKHSIRVENCQSLRDYDRIEEEVFLECLYNDRDDCWDDCWDDDSYNECSLRSLKWFTNSNCDNVGQLWWGYSPIRFV